MGQDIVYARLEKRDRDAYVAGVDLESILRFAPMLDPSLDESKVIEVDASEIPESYRWSIRKVQEFSSWRNTGTYLLIENFEKTLAFERFYPEEAVRQALRQYMDE